MVDGDDIYDVLVVVILIELFKWNYVDMVVGICVNVIKDVGCEGYVFGNKLFN